MVLNPFYRDLYMDAAHWGRLAETYILTLMARTPTMETADGDTLYFRRCPMDGKTCF